jgi:hypothetical protein
MLPLGRQHHHAAAWAAASAGQPGAPRRKQADAAVTAMRCRIRPYMIKAATLRAAAPGASRAALCLEGTLARARRARRGLHH